MRSILTSGLLVAALATGAHAQGDPTSLDVVGAPAPGEESGRVDQPGSGTSTWRTIGRGVLAVPRFALEVVFLPIRGVLYVYERYALDARFKQIFFNEAETVGLYPTLNFDTVYGVTFGGRFVHRDLFGEREHLSVRAGFGGRYHNIFEATLRSGQRFGERIAVEARGELEDRPQDAFYGIGNGAVGTEAHHEQDLIRISTIGDVRVAGDLHVRGAAAFTDLGYGDSDSEPSVEMVYDTSTLTGFMTGVRHVYGELELRYDSRRRGSIWDAPVLPGRGWLLSGYAGLAHQLNELDDYWRTGFDFWRFFWLGRGPRVLSLHFAGETVTGGYDDVAFTELPQLGGKRALRGYPTERFRDRVAIVTSAEYQWDLSRNVAFSMFVDVGRVYSELSAINASDLRVGYGVGLSAMTGHNFIAEALLASSIDGGVFINLAFDPVYDVDPRVVRR
jgi:hypothetical protein